MAEESSVTEYKNTLGVRLAVPCDMPDDVLASAIECARVYVGPAASDWIAKGDAAVEAFKRDMDAKWGPQFHVVVGKNFGSKVTHEAKLFAFFYYGDLACLVFKAG